MRAKRVCKPPRPVPDVTPADVLRFCQKVRVDRRTGCWLWIANTCRKGYGRFWLAGRNHWAHRVSPLVFAAVQLGESHGHHECQTPGCVNPFHVSPLSAGDNARERWSRAKRINPAKVKAVDISDIPI